jgi:hypothetical protein
LKRVVARFYFAQPRAIVIEGDSFNFEIGDSVRLFFSYRYTPALVEARLQDYGLRVMNRWITGSEEEGVFLVTRG